MRGENRGGIGGVEISEGAEMGQDGRIDWRGGDIRDGGGISKGKIWVQRNGERGSRLGCKVG